ncbi:MAG: hypothetical protein DHS20C18_15100 [Saprospiraceae bacterium]|nr:MAG: hypothetical protein DHS20C18_15100 [Saprospiraceae bacterium]
MLDRSKLNSLMGGDEKMVQKFLEIFKTQTPNQLAELKYSITNESWEQASIIAHAIKSQCKYLGLEQSAEWASKIEQLAEEKSDTFLIPGLLVQLEDKLLLIIDDEFGE